MQRIDISTNGNLYRSSMPFSKFDIDKSLLVKFVKKEIDYVILLTEEFEYLNIIGNDLKQIYENANIKVIHYPMKDFGIPHSLITFNGLIDTILNLLNVNRNVVIHCHAGLSRTILTINCLQIKLVKSVEEAVNYIMAEVPQSIITKEQLDFLFEYEKFIHQGNAQK